MYLRNMNLNGSKTADCKQHLLCAWLHEHTLTIKQCIPVISSYQMLSLKKEVIQNLYFSIIFQFCSHAFCFSACDGQVWNAHFVNALKNQKNFYSISALHWESWKYVFMSYRAYLYRFDRESFCAKFKLGCWNQVQNPEFSRIQQQSNYICGRDSL